MEKWLYIECKTQNHSDSLVIERREKLIADLSNQIYSRVKSILNAQHRIEVQLSSNTVSLKDRRSLIENIVVAITEKKTGQWKEYNSIKYLITERKYQPEIPVNHMYGGLLITKENIAVPLTESAVHITCPLGNIVRNALNLITEAREQLPEHFRGLIALKMFNGRTILNHIAERIRQREFGNIAAIIVIDNNNLFRIKNELHGDISDAVLNVPSSLTI